MMMGMMMGMMGMMGMMTVARGMMVRLSPAFEDL
jgi:hypothetical protein